MPRRPELREASAASAPDAPIGARPVAEDGFAAPFEWTPVTLWHEWRHMPNSPQGGQVCRASSFVYETEASATQEVQVTAEELDSYELDATEHPSVQDGCSHVKHV